MEVREEQYSCTIVFSCQECQPTVKLNCHLVSAAVAPQIFVFRNVTQISMTTNDFFSEILFEFHLNS